MRAGTVARRQEDAPQKHPSIPELAGRLPTGKAAQPKQRPDISSSASVVYHPSGIDGGGGELGYQIMKSRVFAPWENKCTSSPGMRCIPPPHRQPTCCSCRRLRRLPVLLAPPPLQGRVHPAHDLGRNTHGAKLSSAEATASGAQPAPLLPLCGCPLERDACQTCCWQCERYS